MTATLPRRNATGPTSKPRRAGRGPVANTVLAWAVAAVLGLVVWETVSFFSGQWVPSVSEVFRSLVAVLTDPGTLGQAWVTLRRVAIVTIAAIAIGVVIGIATGFSWVLRAFLRPILVISLAIPDLVYIIMAILVLGATESSGLVAVTIAIVPLVTNAVVGAVLDRDANLDEMARTYRFSRADYARHVVLEQLKPAMSAAVKTGFAFAWKLVVLMEALTMPDGIGARIYEGFRYLRPQDMLAYAIIFIVIMKLIERLLVTPLASTRY